MPKPSEASHIRMSRRDFSRSAAAAAAGLVASAVPVCAQNTPAEIESGTDTVARSIANRCPGLSEAELSELKDQVKGILDLSGSLKKHPVSNSMEPDFVFHALEVHGAPG